MRPWWGFSPVPVGRLAARGSAWQMCAASTPTSAPGRVGQIRLRASARLVLEKNISERLRAVIAHDEALPRSLASVLSTDGGTPLRYTLLVAVPRKPIVSMTTPNTVQSIL
jgi:hypothetical protein